MGRKGRQLFWYLTLPSLLLSISPMLIGQFVGAFNNFTTISIFTGGGQTLLNLLYLVKLQLILLFNEFIN
ncbi:hypothetical protein NWE60_02065 [Mycoplasmopsis felis]|nr:hypothetical protein [Mycoplasmopsis felis]WAM01402.1 hypothetical protein NWE60_02065 [Mycoplasmopsis felis]